MATTIVIKGLEELQGKLKDIENGVRPALYKATDKAVKYVHSTVPPYPPKPVGSRYRRTGTLGRSITTEVKTLGAETVGVIGTNTVYAPWVISEEKVGRLGPQTWFHKQHGWYTLHKVVRDAKDAIIKIYEETVRRLIN